MIGIVYIGHIKRAPFLMKYLDVLNKNNKKYDIIYWNRSPQSLEGNLENYKARNIYEFDLESDQYKSPTKKIIDFINFGLYAQKIIKKNKYEKLIVLTTMTAMVIRKLLLNQYKGKYIFDYRDASYEYNPIFNNMLKKVIKNSYFTCISSEGFKKILPKNIEYIMSHNIPLLNQSFNYKENYKFKLPIKVGYIGGIRRLDYMKRLVDIFSNDDRFEFHIHGGGGNLDELKKYTKGINNIYLTGEYLESQKGDLIKSADIICYNYLESFNNNIALANKYYDSLIYKIPLLGNIKTYSGKLIHKNNVGISLDMDDKYFKEKLIEYMSKFDYQTFYDNTFKLLEDIKKDEEIFFTKVQEFIVY